MTPLPPMPQAPPPAPDRDAMILAAIEQLLAERAAMEADEEGAALEDPARMQGPPEADPATGPWPSPEWAARY